LAFAGAAGAGTFTIIDAALVAVEGALPQKSEGKKLMEWIINTLCKGVPKGLEELA